MTALTVLQPWAWALIHGPKRVENRSWRTAYRGPLLIHAGKGRGYMGIASSWQAEFGIEFPPPAQIVFGAILGLVDVVDCVPVADVAPSPWASGPWCWIVEKPRAFVEPIFCPGMQMLWTPSSQIMSRVESLLRSAQVGAAAQSVSEIRSP